MKRLETFNIEVSAASMAWLAQVLQLVSLSLVHLACWIILHEYSTSSANCTTDHENSNWIAAAGWGGVPWYHTVSTQASEPSDQLWQAPHPFDTVNIGTSTDVTVQAGVSSWKLPLLDLNAFPDFGSMHYQCFVHVVVWPLNGGTVTIMENMHRQHRLLIEQRLAHMPGHTCLISILGEHDIDDVPDVNSIFAFQ